MHRLGSCLRYQLMMRSFVVVDDDLDDLHALYDVDDDNVEYDDDVVDDDDDDGDDDESAPECTDQAAVSVTD